MITQSPDRAPTGRDRPETLREKKEIFQDIHYERWAFQVAEIGISITL